VHGHCQRLAGHGKGVVDEHLKPLAPDGGLDRGFLVFVVVVMSIMVMVMMVARLGVTLADFLQPGDGLIAKADVSEADKNADANGEPDSPRAQGS
jgi:hypothetical protein